MGGTEKLPARLFASRKRSKRGHFRWLPYGYPRSNYPFLRFCDPSKIRMPPVFTIPPVRDGLHVVGYCWRSGGLTPCQDSLFGEFAPRDLLGGLFVGQPFPPVLGDPGDVSVLDQLRQPFLLASVAGAFGARRSGGVQAGLFAGGKAQVSFHLPKKTRPARSHWSHLCQSKTGKQKEIRPKSQPAVDSATGFSLIIVLPLNLPGPIPYRPLGKVSLPPTEMKNHHFSSKTAKFPLPFLEIWGIFRLSAVENGDSVIPMLSDRSFDMQKQCPILPHREREKSPF